MLSSADNSNVFRTYCALENIRVVHSSADEKSVYTEQVVMGGPRLMKRKYRLAVLSTAFPKMLAGEFHLVRPGGMRVYQVRPNLASARWHRWLVQSARAL